MAIGTVYRFLIYDRHFACRLDRKWPVPVPAAVSTPTDADQHQQLSDVETAQLIMGMTYSLKNMLGKLSPGNQALSMPTSPAGSRKSSVPSGTPITPSTETTSPVSASAPSVSTSTPASSPPPSSPSTSLKFGSECCFSYVASKYRLIYYESPTRWKLVLLAEPGSPVQAEMETLMRTLYREVFVRQVVQNPAYRMDEASFERPGLLVKLDEFIMAQGTSIKLL